MANQLIYQKLFRNMPQED